MYCVEPAMDIPGKCSVAAMALRDDLLFSGDTRQSCPPILWQAQSLRMVDAQGNHIAHDGIDASGKKVERVEELAPET